MSTHTTVPFSTLAALGGLVGDDPGVVHGEGEDLRPWHPCSDELPHPSRPLVLPASKPALERLLVRALGTSSRGFHRKRAHGDWGIGTIVFTPEADKDSPDALHIHVPELDEWVPCKNCGGTGRTPPKDATHIGGSLWVKPLGSIGPTCLSCGGLSEVRSAVHMDMDKAFAACINKVASQGE